MENTVRRLRGLWVVLLVVLVAGAAGTATASATPSAQVSALTAKQKKAKKRELARCKKQKKAKQRKACKKRVHRKYARLARKGPKPRNGKTWKVDVMDDFYRPDVLRLRAGDWIDWTWRYSTVREGHNVNLDLPFPRGVIAGDFQSPGVVTGPGGRFRRQFTKPGIYNLYCNLHAGMTMTVTVKK